ncbi:MAG TPA: methionine biosynthesis protein MetW, partial [Polyangiaceae bacterium]|nr:methionine biosynthesis protein MetW [Polyangiaceae bacterium]
MSAAVSLVYAHPWVYQGVMRALYGRGFDARYRAIAELIEPGSEVFEVCAGDGYLYRRYLQPKAVRYAGGDINEAFLRHARRSGIAIQRLDAVSDPIPVADYVVIQASLYQFIPHHLRLLESLLGAARRSLIVAEPIVNLSTSSSGLVRWLAQRSANPGDGHKAARFDEASLDAALRGHFGDRIQS